MIVIILFLFLFGISHHFLATMQEGYEHSVPKVKGCNSKRKVLVFRNGEKKETVDTGEVATTKPVIRLDGVWFGHSNIPNRMFTRKELFDYNLHR